MIKNTEYSDFLKDILKRYFDIYENVNYDDMQFDLYAEYKKRNTRYMLTKKLEVYGFEENEFLFYKNMEERFTEKDLDNLKSFLDENITKIIDLENDHMSTLITFVINLDAPIDDVLIKKIEKYKYYKSFMFGLKGWVNCKIIVLDENNNIITNKLGQKGCEKFCPAS